MTRIATVLVLVLTACGAAPAPVHPSSSDLPTEARAALPRAATGDGLRLVTHWPIEETDPRADDMIDLDRLLASVQIEVVDPDGKTARLRPHTGGVTSPPVRVADSSGAVWIIEAGGLRLVPLVDTPGATRAVTWSGADPALFTRPGRYRVTITGGAPLGRRALRFATPPVTIELVEPRPALRPLAELDARARLSVATTHRQLDQGREPVELRGDPATAVANPAGNRVLRYVTVDGAGLRRTWQVTVRPDGEVVGLVFRLDPACAGAASCAGGWQRLDPWETLYRPLER